MEESIVNDWLADYKRIQGQPAELAEFAVEHETDPEIAEAIYAIFNGRQHQNYETLVHDICQQLLAFYRAPETELRKFPLQFLPVLIYTYLHAVAAGDKRSAARSIETLLICIYNAEVSTDDGGQRVVSFRMPILAQASVYHEEKNLPMTDLRRWEENCNREVKWGPNAQIEAITAQNRLKVMTALLFCYNQQLCLTQKSALIHLCRVASHLVTQGFTKHQATTTTTAAHAHRMSYGSDGSIGSSALMPKSTTPRIPLSSGFLVELVHAIYFAMFNGFGTVAIQTLEDIHHRACYEMYTELILVTSAVRNSLHANPSGQPSDGPMGLSVALTPATNTVTTVSKSMITNASFRTKKLPDDIPIQVQDLTMQQVPAATQSQASALASVSEENEVQNAKESSAATATSTTTTRNSIIRPSMAQAHKALIAGFKKSKDKEKEKDREKAAESNISGGGGGSNSKGGSNSIMTTTITNTTSNEPPKPPIRKFDKHHQQQQQQQHQHHRNSMLQRDQQETTNANASNSPTTTEKSPSSLAGVKSKTPYDSLEANDMLPMQMLSTNESGSGSFSIDSEINGVGGGGGGNLMNNNSMASNTTTSLASSDLITKSFDSSIELMPMPSTTTATVTGGGGGGGKIGETIVD